jgi:hypothetical protein
MSAGASLALPFPARRLPPRLAGAAVLGVVALASGCSAVSEQERREEAAWNACIEGEIAARRAADGRLRSSGQTVFFEVTYDCRTLFPAWDKAGHTRRGRKLLTSLYHRLATAAGPVAPAESR